MMKTNELKQLALDALQELKAIDITTLDVANLTTITDILIVCSGRSSKHIQSIADNLIQTAKHHQNPPFGVDGKRSKEWVLVDLGDVVVNIMTPATRERYQLETLWAQRDHAH